MGLKCRHRGAQYGHMGQGGSTPQCGIPAQSPQGPSNGGSDYRIAQTAVGRGFSALEAISLKTHRAAQRELGFRDSGGRGIAQPQPLTHPRRTSSPFRKKQEAGIQVWRAGESVQFQQKGQIGPGLGPQGFVLGRRETTRLLYLRLKPDRGPGQPVLGRTLQGMVSGKTVHRPRSIQSCARARYHGYI